MLAGGGRKEHKVGGFKLSDFRLVSDKAQADCGGHDGLIWSHTSIPMVRGRLFKNQKEGGFLGFFKTITIFCQ